MGATIYQSHALVERLSAQLRNEAALFHNHYQRMPRLAQIVVGQDAAAAIYSRQVMQACRRLGLSCLTLTYPFETTEEELRAEVARLSEDVTVDGVTLQLPLPEHIRQRVVMEALRPEKDVDGLGPRNAGNLLLGFPNFIPSTADAVRVVLDEAQINLKGRHAVVVGRSNMGGKPIALVLIQRDATVTICHSHTPDLQEITRGADVLVVSVGRPALITAEMVKPGAIVLDAGINMFNGHIVGDVAHDVREVASFLTPVPGGLGPLTHLTLLRHTLMGPQ